MMSTQKNPAFALAVIVFFCGTLGPVEVEATICGSSPSLDTSYESATAVVVARLVTASLSKGFIARSEFEEDFVLKGEPIKDLTLEINIDPLSSCGPDLVIGKVYVIFLVEEKSRLFIVNDPNTFHWIERKTQTPSSK